MGQKAGSGEGEEVLASLDMRLPSSKLRYMVYVLGKQLSQIPLTDRFPKAEYGADKAVKGSIEMSAAGVSLFGHPAQLGKNTLEGFERFKGVDFFLVSTQVAQTKFMRLNAKDYFILGGSDSAAVHTPDTSRIILHENSATVEVGSDFVYFNSQRLTDFAVIKEMHPGDTLLTPSLLLERRPSQWKLTVFRPEEIIWHHKAFLEQEGLSEFPQDFPDYRRSPRLNLERPTDQLKLQKIEAPEAPNKNGLLKAILPPIGMLAVSVVMAVISGRNPLMMLGMGFMSVMTAIFTITQYMTEKKERQTANRQREEDYEVYLLGAVADISEKYAEEKRVLDYKSPSPERLTEMMTQYDPRIYERMRPNKDFLEVSLGLGTQASSLTVEAEATARDHDEASERIKMLASRFSSQKDSPVTLNLLGQTLGFIGNDEVLKTAVANLLLQLAFFHSYRDVNFISLVPEKSYATDWMGWRFLPHVKIQDLNIRGLVHNAKTRDMILNSFLQILNQRKQIVKEAGKEIPTFSPHYLLTLFDDSYLAGHGLNEFLAEDMSELGVTVIWCKEDQKLLPETVTALVSYQNQGAGQILNDHQVYVAKDFVPYPKTEGLETALRTLANLNHVEVEKNAIPESLSLLAQYEVKTIPELKISERWALAEPNKSIKSLIGWRGKSDAVYWDLHERVHGPHALVGGTTGSGKSEFLTTFLIGLAINFSPEDIGMLIIDWKGGGIANTLDKLPHFMGAITNLDGAGTARALASIKAELDKRMLEFAKYGVNNINGYMSLYKQRQDKDRNPEISYPDQPIPHLILVSDEFAELKSNVPEFLDELTSVARIGRSLGVHLILATQKPSGVVNDQIEANSTSKIALKMA
ncbi:MAG: type VII secretion protein EssC, partial [Streptococcaceae bacterium]|nr:type VII secretion protein EssC [Streptococcaceae bacterium]